MCVTFVVNAQTLQIIFGDTFVSIIQKANEHDVQADEFTPFVLYKQISENVAALPLQARHIRYIYVKVPVGGQFEKFCLHDDHLFTFTIHRKTGGFKENGSLLITYLITDGVSNTVGSVILP